MKKTFAYGAAVSQGTWPLVEDGFFADPVRGFFALADGFGGRGAGDMAAKAALLESRAQSGAEARLLKEVFHDVHKALSQRNSERAPNRRGGCSLVTAKIWPDGFLSLQQSGVCGAFLVRDGKIIPLLLPQSSPREESRPLLPEQALGLGEPQPESRRVSFKPGDILALFSSGLEWETEAFQSDLLGQLAIRIPGDDLGPLAQELLDRTSLSSQSWNRTLVLVEAPL